MRQEKPAYRQVRVVTQILLDAEGRGVYRQSAGGFLGPGRDLVVLVEAR